MTGQCAELVQSELNLSVDQADYIASLGGTSRRARALSGEDDSKIMIGWKPPKALREVNNVAKDLEKFKEKMGKKVRKAQKKASGKNKWVKNIAKLVCPRVPE